MKYTPTGTVAFLLCLLILGAYPSQAQVSHENPSSLTPLSPYGAKTLTTAPTEPLFLSMDSIVTALQGGDYNVSRETLKGLLASYGDLAGALNNYNLSDEESRLILDRLNLTADEIGALINDTEAYDSEYSDFNAYVEAGDSANASQTAARLQDSYAGLSSSARAIADNSTCLVDQLSGTGADTAGIESFLASLSDYTARVASENQLPSAMAPGSRLLLSCDQAEAKAGDSLSLTARHFAADDLAAGQDVDFYADNVKIGSAVTDSSGLCSFNYTVGSSFRDPLRLSASLSRGADRPRLTSNLVEVHRLSEPACLQISAYPDQARFGDSVEVRGSLVTAAGFPVPRRNVSLWLGDLGLGNAKTGSDGSFACRLNVSADRPSGQIPLTARYDQRPGDTVSGNTSNVVLLNLIPESTQLSLDTPESLYHGGSAGAFNGTLLAGNGRPVEGGNVSLYLDGTLLEQGVTNANGTYGIALTVPYDLSRGNYSLYAAYQPGEGRVLAGSNSPAYAVAMEPGAPTLATLSQPIFAFPGDPVTVEGLLTVDGRPLAGRPVDLCLSGQVLATAITDAGGRFRLSADRALSPGLCTLSVRSGGAGLLAASERATLPFVAMPFGLPVVVLIGALLLAGILALAKIAGVDRILLKRLSREEAPAPEAAPTPLQDLPEPGEMDASPDLSFEEEIATIDRFIADGGGTRDSITLIYKALRRLAGSYGLTVEKSDTHRDLARKLCERNHSLNVPLNTILYYYEYSVFGHYLPNAQDIMNALYCLREVQSTLSGRSGQ